LYIIQHGNNRAGDQVISQSEKAIISQIKLAALKQQNPVFSAKNIT